MPASAPSLFNTALRFAGIDSCQLRREVRETSAADWHKFCDQRAGTRTIEHAERAEERHVARSARKRLDQEVMAIAEAHGAEETLVAEARVARTTATKLRFIARHGGDLAGSLSALAGASVFFFFFPNPRGVGRQSEFLTNERLAHGEQSGVRTQ